MKRIIIIILVLINVSAFAQQKTAYQSFLADADNLFNTGEYLKAYQMYFYLFDKKEFPDFNADTLTQRIVKTGETIDLMRNKLNTYIEETNKLLRKLEATALENAISKAKNEWLQKNHSKKSNEFSEKKLNF